MSYFQKQAQIFIGQFLIFYNINRYDNIICLQLKLLIHKQSINTSMISFDQQKHLLPFCEVGDDLNYNQEVYIMIATSGEDKLYRQDVIKQIKIQKEQLIKQEQQKKEQENKKKPQKKAPMLPGVSYDLSNFKRVIASKNPTSVHILETSQSQNLYLTKQYVLTYLWRKMKFAEKICYLFYSGHGDRSGNWIVETVDDNYGQAIQLQQILHIWDCRPRAEAKLIIIMDSCHSGAWCNQLKTYDRKDVAIFASSDASLTSTQAKGGNLMNSLFKWDNFLPAVNQILKQKANFITFNGYILPLQYVHLVEANKNPSFLFNLAQFVKIKEGQQDYEGQIRTLPDNKFIKHGYGLYRNHKSRVVYAGYWKENKKQGKGARIYFEEQTQKQQMGLWKNDKLILKSNEKFYNKVDTSPKQEVKPKQEKPVQKNYDITPQGYEFKKLKGFKNSQVEKLIKCPINYRVEYKDGSLYIGGLLQNGNKHGFGTRIYKNGEIYQGYYKNEKRHGPGLQIPAGSDVTLQGMWSQGGKQGSFLKTLNNGSSLIIQFNANKIVQQN